MLRKAVNLVTLAHYVLMNKNTPVLSFDYDLGDHKAVRIREVFAPEAAPFGFVDRRGDISKAELNYWWRHAPSLLPVRMSNVFWRTCSWKARWCSPRRASGCRFPTATG